MNILVPELVSTVNKLLHSNIPYNILYYLSLLGNNIFIQSTELNIIENNDFHYFQFNKSKNKIDLILSFSGFTSFKRNYIISNKIKAPIFQYIFSDLFLDLRTFLYVIFKEFPKDSPKRLAMMTYGLLPKFIRKLGFEKFPQFIVPTQYLANQLELMKVNPKSIKIIPFGVDTQFFSPIGKKVFKNRDRKYIFYFGGTPNTPLRGFKLIKSAFKIVKQKFKNISLILALGGKPKKTVDGYINFGYYPNMNELINSMDIICLPFKSTYAVSSIPLSILESMSCGKPVITTKIDAIPEVIESYKDGILTTYDEFEVAQAIIELLSNQKLYRSISLNARKKILAKFDIVKVSNEINNYLKSKIEKD